MSGNGRWYDTESQGHKAIGRNRPIFIISENAYHDLYRSLSLEGEEIEICAYRDALAKFEKSGADIILLDCAHNSSVCLNLITELKRSASNVPVIVLQEKGAQEVMPGARLCLTKPLNILELKTIVGKLLVLKRSSRENRTPLLLDKSNPEEVSAAANTDQPVNILKVIQYIENNFAEKISLDILAQEANLSKYHFCRFFTKYTGMSPMKFVASLRIEKAKELLKRQDQTISIISYLTGFNDLGTFIRQFKSATGLTPSVYQEARLKAKAGSHFLSG